MCPKMLATRRKKNLEDYILGQGFSASDVHTDFWGASLQCESGLRPEVLHL